MDAGLVIVNQLLPHMELKINMRSRDFAYWLQGFFEISDTNTLSEKQVHLIKQHLNLVFKHEIDPSMGDEKHQQELNTIHNSLSGRDPLMRC